VSCAQTWYVGNSLLEHDSSDWLGFDRSADTRAPLSAMLLSTQLS
jgi:hypothetical protein